MAAESIVFEVPGIERDAAAAPAPDGFRVAHSARLGSQRGANKTELVTARPGRDVVVLTLKDGPRLMLHPQHARELLLAQRGTARDAAGSGSPVPVPVTLGWPGLEAPASRGRARGWLGQGELLSLDVLTALHKPAAALAAADLARMLDGRVKEGLYRLMPDARPGKLTTPERKIAPAHGPLLVLVHGTFVDTGSTFGKLWLRKDGMLERVFRFYDGRVYALEHATVGASPIANALTLAQALPKGAVVHLLTHSRGGLVAEVLARACSGAPLDARDRQYFTNRDSHLADLKALFALAARKGLRVERIVRVACPARGTLLASSRLDAYLSVLRWLLGLAGGAAADAVAGFLHEVALRRTEADALPGLEAMMPERPLVNWLNDGGRTIGGDLRVIAGDIEADSPAAWLKTLVADAFYWTDNDLIVQTRSMYGGFPRAAQGGRPAATFLLDRGGTVSHFEYFGNGTTATAVCRALTEADPAGFQPIGPLSWEGKAGDGVRGGRLVSRGGPAPELPAVFVLPGILGSNIERGDRRLWLGFRFLNSFDELAWSDSTAGEYRAASPLYLYDDLIDDLAATHDVIPFPFDWRAPIEQEARRLARAVDAALDVRRASGQPVRLLAHSMGGLVARTMQLEAPATWDRLMAVPGARLLMLGTPNGGSWAPLQTLSGDDSFGNVLASVGSLFNRGRAREIMAGMPGFIQLQAGLLDAAANLADAATWQRLADKDERIMVERSSWHATLLQRDMYKWSAPPQAVLDRAVDLRRRLDNQRGALAQWDGGIVIVVGEAPLTPAGFEMTEAGLEYTNVAGGGDGRVTLENALLPGIRAWSLAAEHGRLPQARHAFGAMRDLLATGTTTRLPEAGAAQRGAVPRLRAMKAAGRMVRSRPSRGEFDELVPADPLELAGMLRPGPGAQPPPPAETPLRVAVCNGDFRFVRPPLMLGHYQSASLSGSEAVMDRLLGGAMSESLGASLYPNTPGAHQIFNNRSPDPANPLSLPRPPDVIVIGLGPEGKLRSTDLVDAVRQGIVAYAQRLGERNERAPFKLAATLIGSGGTHITVGTAAMSIVHGAVQANERLRGVAWPPLAELTIVELYLDRACEALRAIQVQEKASQKLTADPVVRFTQGALRRPIDSGYRGANYDFISALAGSSGDERYAPITFVLDTRRARTEVTAQRTQVPLLRELVLQASNDVNPDTRIGRTLFNLLIPSEIEPYLAGTSDLVIELNKGTAGLPWELLTTRDDDDPSRKPWAVRCKLIRKVQTREFRALPRDAQRDDAILVIGEPQSSYAPLPGARREAKAVQEAVLASLGPRAGGAVRLFEQADAKTIINALFERDYRVIHIAGHGKEGANGGVVLSGDDIFLGAEEVKAMRVTPELVFLNCCHLGARDTAELMKPDERVARAYDRADFAATIADALIGAGVRCVIAAGWAVDDTAAVVFAQTFYTALLNGQRFIDAVGMAREATWSHNCNCNTWAAYQCYGDPEWTFRSNVDPGTDQPEDGDEHLAISSADSLIILLERICYDNKYDIQRTTAPKDRIDRLAAAFAPLWSHIGVVAEAFGQAYESVEAYGDAERWYRAAIDADDGTASFRANELLAALLLLLPPSQASKANVTQGIERLKQLVAIHPTARRANLLGAGHKLLAKYESAPDAGADVPEPVSAPPAAPASRHAPEPAAPAGERDALTEAAKHFADAARLADDGSPLKYEAAKSGMACELRLALRAPRHGEVAWPSVTALRDIGRVMARDAAADPTFRNVVGQIELQVYEAVINGTLARECGDLRSSFNALKERVPSPNDWRQVAADTDFVLAPYGALADAAERAAAHELVELLNQLAGQEVPRVKG